MHTIIITENTAKLILDACIGQGFKKRRPCNKNNCLLLVKKEKSKIKLLNIKNKIQNNIKLCKSYHSKKYKKSL